jgi:transposase
MGRPTKYPVALKDEERARLQGLVRRGKAAARQVTRARILLLADAKRPQTEITAALQVSRGTVQRVCKRYCEEGLDAALAERPRPGARRKLDGKQEATLVALACSDAPEGRSCWTMQLLADRMVELQVVDRISDETVRRTLKRGR